MDFIDEQHIALIEVGQLRREIAGFRDHRAGGRAEIDAKFARDDLRQCRLAETGRADEQHMIERLAARFGRLNEDLQVLLRLRLPDEFTKLERADGGIHIIAAFFGVEEAGAGHVTSPAPSIPAG